MATATVTTVRRRAPRAIGMALFVVLVLGPLYWVTMSSFKTRREILQQSPTWVPEHPTLENYQALFTATDYPTYLRNSAIVALLTTAVSLVVSIAAAYGLYRLKIPGGGKVAGLILVGYMIPGTLLIVPLYQLLAQLQLIDTLAGLIIVNVAFTAPFCTWLLRGFIQAVPEELDEAASLDGAGPMLIMVRVVLPLLLPGMATVAVYAFIYSWTEFVYASQFIVSDSLRTLPLGLNAIVGQYTVDWGLVTAGTVFTLLPTVVLFAFIGRYFVSGLIAGSSR